ncbi:MAG: hypothetical protein QNJ60_09320 [Xenococcaceae cyanobacterium MO_188.B19]|nr:hypothetical protein [Xenococcaceae cyanobacterium MO_188.B19]
MTKQHKLLVKATKSVGNLSELNPQLLREIKGRLKGINIIIAVCLSLVVQLFIVIKHLGRLPDLNYQIKQYSRYCFSYTKSRKCHTNLLGHWDINWQLFWLDTFIALSIVIIIALLVGGVYLLISDLIKEQQRGTLSFIQFSPQSARSILTGKILGVPILLYLAVLLTFPLHSIAAFQAGISLSLIVGFDITVIAFCWLFYSLALLFSLISTNFVGFKPWLASGLVGLFLLLIRKSFYYNYHAVSNNIFDWAFLSNPITILPYFIKQSNLLSFYKYYLSVEHLRDISFYGQHLWNSSSAAIGFILINYYVWQYWIWQGIKRSFDNPNNTTFSKKQSYWITGCFIFYALGFTLQTTKSGELFNNFLWLQCFLLCFFLGLMALLSPKYQTLQDWARYRHQSKKSQRILSYDLLFGAKSPGIVAIAINLAIATIYTIPALLIFDFTKSSQQVIWGLILGVSIILLYGLIAQFILLTKNTKRATWSLITVLALVIIPPLFLGIAGVEDSSNAFLITFLPTLAIESAQFSTIITVVLGQWLTICLTGFAITKQLRQLGKSETTLIS